MWQSRYNADAAAKCAVLDLGVDYFSSNLLASAAQASFSGRRKLSKPFREGKLRDGTMQVVSVTGTAQAVRVTVQKIRTSVKSELEAVPSRLRGTHGCTLQIRRLTNTLLVGGLRMAVQRSTFYAAVIGLRPGRA